MNTFRSLFIKALFILFLLIAIGGYAQNKELNLMPFPATIEMGDGHFYIQKNFSVSLEGDFNERLNAEATRFLRRLDARTGLFFTQHKVTGQQAGAALAIVVERPGRVELHEDEGYELNITPQKITLSSKTDLGAIRGLETLLQLLTSDQQYYFPVLTLQDQPRFPWRGLMLDVARHYMPMDVIFRNIDAMAAVKLNVLHLHLSDDQGFRFESKVYPKLTELASDGNFYTQAELTKIIKYADQRGIRIMPEIDVPGHATSFLVAYPELGSKDTTYVLERNAGIFDPTLNPANDEVYVFLENLFTEIAGVFPDAFFHLGGDENMGKHWDENQQIQDFKAKHNLKTNHDLQTYFNIRLQKILAGVEKRVMGWEEIMTPQMPKTAVIHSWKGEWEEVPPKTSLYQAARTGYETVLSNGYYLDLMQPASYHYAVDPAPSDLALSPEERKRILGGEMCMWSELVVPATVDSRLWPRGAAVAERLWSPEEVKDIEDMYRRLEHISLHLEQLGLAHITARDVILRNLAAGREVKPLKTLVEVVEPMKGYTRNPGGTMYVSYSPFTLWADAATPDAPVARNFNSSVSAYIKGQQDGKGLREQLQDWKENHQHVLPIINSSPVLNEIKQLSASFSEVAGVGLEAITFLESNQVPQSGWVTTSKKALKRAAENGGRTELQVISGIEMLVAQVEARAK